MRSLKLSEFKSGMAIVAVALLIEWAMTYEALLAGESRLLSLPEGHTVTAVVSRGMDKNLSPAKAEKSRKQRLKPEVVRESFDGCVIHQVKLSNYRKGLHGMPVDIPKPPAFVFGGTSDHSFGRYFGMGSKQSPSALKSWYRRQLPDNGWSVLLDDTIKTRFGSFERLFAKTGKACISVVIANAPAGMSYQSVVGVYTYPGPGKSKAPDNSRKE